MVQKIPKTGKDLVRLAEKSDQVIRVRSGKGSHFIVEFKNGTNVSIPVHGNEQISKGLLNKIIKYSRQRVSSCSWSLPLA